MNISKRLIGASASVAFVTLVLLLTGSPREHVDTTIARVGPAAFGHGLSDADRAAQRLRWNPGEGVWASSMWWAPIGRRFTYRVDGTLAARISMGDVPPRGGSFSFGGDAVVTVLDRRGGEVVFALDAHQVSFVAADVIGGAPQDGPRADGPLAPLVDRTLVRMRWDGSTLGYRFPDGYDGEARSWIRTLVAATRFVVPDNPGERWSAEETDATGTFVGEYRTQDPDDARKFVLVKSKDQYTTTLEMGDLSSTPSVRGSARGAMDLKEGWLSDVHHEEQIVFEAGKVRLRVETTLALDVQLTHSAQAESDWTDDVWGSDWEPVNEPVRETMPSGAATESIDAPTQIAEIDALLRTNGEATMEVFEAQRALAALIVDEPSILDDLRGDILAGRFGDEAAMILAGAAGFAGTPEAQAFLVSVVTEASLRPSLRQGVLFAMFQLRSPEPETTTAVAALARSLSSPGPTRGRALLILGKFAAGGGAGTVDRRAFETLLEMESMAVADGAEHAWLRALGNCRCTEAVAPLSTYVNDTDPTVRSAAIGSLRGVASSDAAKLAGNALTNDPDGDVRFEAASAYVANWDHVDARFLGDVLREEPSPDVRAVIYRGLGERAAQGTDAYAVLLGGLEDPDPSNRALVGDLSGQGDN
ncbi:MAG: HEAT repeat domain-containing protein [Planctomycetota bacterium]